jgi:hypothetical protein
VANSKENTRGFYRKPFWLPATHYYFLTLLFSVLLFIFSLMILYESDNKSFLVASFLSGILMVAAFVFREFFLRKSRDDFLKAQRKLDENLRIFTGGKKKLTLEQHSFLIKRIECKSEAARTLADLSEAHRNVFESCNEYLNLIGEELKEVSVESPRLTFLLKGKRKVERIRKYHVLVWAELEAKNLMNNLKQLKKVSDKLRLAYQTLETLNVALSYYPTEQKLVESVMAVEELIISIKVSSCIRKANRASSQKKYEIAVEHYRNALSTLSQSKAVERQALIEKINQEIQRLGEKKQKEG